MSYYSRQYPVLEKNVWTFDTSDEFRPGTFEDTVLSDFGPQVAPGKRAGTYTTPPIDAGQAVVWNSIAWRADLRLGSSIVIRIRFGATEEECLNARWSAAYDTSPAKISCLERNGCPTPIAARFVQIRSELVSGMGGSPTLMGIRLEAGLVPPACVGPVNLGVVEDGKPVFYWTRVEGAASYTLELSDSPDFSGEVFRQDGLECSFFAYPRTIKPGDYYWRVRAIDGSGCETDWSPTRQFKVGERPWNIDDLEHPYLFFKKEDIPAIRGLLVSKHSATWTDILRRANEALDGELPEEKEILLTPGQHGGFHTLVSQVARGQLEPLAFTFLITEEEKYAARARDIMLNLAGFSRWTGIPFGDPNCFYPAWQAALETAGMCKGVATAYDWLYDFLSDDERAAIRAALLRLGVLPILESWADPRTIRYVPRHQLPAGNWWSVCNSGGGIAALALLPEVPDARNWLGMFVDAVRAYLVYPGGDIWNIDLKAGWGGQCMMKTYPNWGEDGGYVESLGYVDYGLTNAMYFIDALKRVTGEDMSPYINRKLIDQPYYFLCRTSEGTIGTVNFNDSGQANLSDDLYALLSRHLRCSRSKYLLKTGYPILKNIHAVLADDANVEAETPNSEEANKLFTDIGWCVFRSGWSDDESILAAKFTHGRGHQDIGQFVIHYKGYPFIIDPGVVAYSDPVYKEHLCTSYAHNLVLVDGQCQLKSDGRILGYAQIPGAGIVEADLTSAYEDLVNLWTRTLVYLEPETFIVIDRLSSDIARSYSWQIHPNGRVEIKPGIGATIYHDSFEIQFKLVSPIRWSGSIKQGYIGSTPAEYLSFEPQTPCKDITFFGVFTGAERGRNIGVDKVDDGNTVKIRVITPEATHIVLVQHRNEADMAGWGLHARARTCAATFVKGYSEIPTRWLIAGSGPMCYSDKVLAETASKNDFRAGTTSP